MSTINMVTRRNMLPDLANLIACVRGKGGKDIFMSRNKYMAYLNGWYICAYITPGQELKEQGSYCFYGGIIPENEMDDLLEDLIRDENWYSDTISGSLEELFLMNSVRYAVSIGHMSNNHSFVEFKELIETYC